MILLRWLRLEKIQSTFQVGTTFLFGKYLSWPERIVCFPSLSRPALLQYFAVWCWPRGINGMCSILILISLWDIPEDKAGLLLLLPPFLFATPFCLVASRLTTVGDELCKAGAICTPLAGRTVGICLCWTNYCSFLTDVLENQRALSSERILEGNVVRSQVQIVAVLCSFLGFFFWK